MKAKRSIHFILSILLFVWVCIKFIWNSEQPTNMELLLIFSYYLNKD